MKAETLSERLENLSEAAQRRVEALISELEQRQGHASKRSGSLRDEPFVGLWKDRSDMADSNAWVRRTRQNEWQHG